MPLFFTKSNLIYDHPLNKDWIDLHYMTDVELTQWWNKLCKLLIEDYEKNGMPPRKGVDEEEIYKQFHQAVSYDIEKQISIDTSDGGAVILNSQRISAATHFFENMYVAKDKRGDDWVSVMDIFRNPKYLSITRLIKNDGRFVFSEFGTSKLSITEYILENREEYDFWFVFTNKRTKHYFGKVKGKVSEVKELIRKKLIRKETIRDLENLKDSDSVYLRQVKKNKKFLPTGFTIFESGSIMAPTNFPVIVAKTIYEKFGIPAKDGGETVIWDPSMGFGGRLLGALSSTKRNIHYIGTDPNSLNYFKGNSSRYLNLERVFKNEIRIRKNTFRGTYIKSGSEDVHNNEEFKKHKGKVDLVFTSPPYFSAELYNEEETQSSIKFKDYDDWRRHFLTRTLQTATEWTRNDGYILWNIANSGGYPLEEDTKLICKALGLRFKGVIKMLIAKTPGLKTNDGKLTTWNFARVRGKQSKYEPIFVFQKEKEMPKEIRFKYSKLYQPKLKGGKNGN
jgi:hypothetical protein